MDFSFYRPVAFANRRHEFQVYDHIDVAILKEKVRTHLDSLLAELSSING